MTNVKDNTRAGKGGEIGLNGEFYSGGQFLPGSSGTVKGEFKTAKTQLSKTRKVEIAPYKWVVTNKDPILGSCFLSMYTTFKRTGYSKENGSIGEVIVNNDIESIKNYRGKKLSAEFITLLRDTAKRWNDGERFFEDGEWDALREKAKQDELTRIRNEEMDTAPSHGLLLPTFL